MVHTETLGTLGYIAPEYGLEGVLSISGDLWHHDDEVLTKRRPTEDEIFNENLGLRQWIRRAFPGTIMEVVDVNLFHEEESVNFKIQIMVQMDEVGGLRWNNVEMQSGIQTNTF
uniref:Protein kinase domain-containing protein n=1 Tax=Solanum lycopersicum TaxID=4081 RepID=A0A3Q7FZU9_SOLLC